MRGRRPDLLTVRSDDEPILLRLSQSQSSPWFLVQRARIVLALAAGQRTVAIAAQMQCEETTVWRAGQRYRRDGLAGLLADGRVKRSGRQASISPLQRAQIVALACLEPLARGLHITHWSRDDLAKQAVADGIVSTISGRTVGRILVEVDLQPYRTRYWRTTRLDPRFKQRSEKVLWCYANADRLAQLGIWVICADEMPNCQVLERAPIRRGIPGSIEQAEFDYTRHGTVNILNVLIVHTGKMEAFCLAANDADHYVQALKQFRRTHHRLRGVNQGLRTIVGRLPGP